MRFVAHGEGGGPEALHLAEGAAPEPGVGEVVIAVAAAGVNRPDLLQRAGRYPPPVDASPVLGLEVAGRVDAVGAGVEWPRVGDLVCALAPGGGYAERCAVSAAHCLPVPEGVSLIEAAALPEAALTVWANVFELGRLCAGETILVHGGSGGIGTMAIQLGRARGATVLATAGGAAKVAYCLRVGANAVIDHRTDDFVAEVRRHTAGRGVDVILDVVGGDYVARNLRALAVEGRLVQIGFLASSRAQVDFSSLLLKRLSIVGSTLRHRSSAEKARLTAAVRREVWPHVRAGAVRPPVTATFALGDARRAHELMESGTHVGKIVLVP